MFIIWLDQVGANAIGLVGGKGANLGEMTRAGLPVPPGFCITAGAYQQLIDSAGLWPAINALLAQVKPEDTAGLEQVAGRIRELVMQAPLPPDLATAVRHAYHRLAGTDGPVAVRSSATAEDLPEASFAGQQETYLNVRGETDLLVHVQRCWASLWTARAISYREQNGFDHRQVRLAVVVQALVDPETAGVLFTANPLNGSRQEILVNAAYGLGEAVVSGQVTPDTYRLRRGRPIRVMESIRGDKALAMRRSPTGGTIARPVPAEDRNRLCLSRRDLQALADLAGRVEAHYGVPQDIEWCMAGGQVYLLQARPITSLGAALPPLRPLSRLERTILDDILEHYPDPPYPLDYEAVTAGYEALQDLLRGAGLRVPPARSIIRMEADGTSTITPRAPRPTWRLLRLPWTIRKLLAPDPAALMREKQAVFAARLAALRATATGTLSDRALAEQIEAAVALATEIAQFRFTEIIGPMMIRGALLRLLFRLGKARLQTETELLGGLTYKSLEIDQDLRALAAAALAEPQVAGTILDRAPAEIAPALQATSAGRAFMEQVEGFFQAHGARTMKVYLPFSNRSWAEDPTAFWATLAAMVRAGEPGGAGVGTRGEIEAGRGAEAGAEAERGAEAGAEAPAEARARTAAGRFAARRDQVARRLPGLLRRRFLAVLERFRSGHVAREATLYAIEEAYAVARQAVTVAARRLFAAGALPAAEDVRFLTLTELTTALRGDAAGVRKRVTDRRRARSRAAAAWRRGVAAQGAATGDLTGLGASPGVATGPVKVVGGPAEFGKVQPGDVLVCAFTDPAWTPLFALAAAVVADTGGPLSHAAIVAREYGIPAVLGTQVATRQLQDGEVVTVDGQRGTVVRVRTG